MKVGDRVTFTEKVIAYDRGWPVGQNGEVIASPYQGVWVVRLDDHPESKVPVTTNTPGVKVL